MGGSQSQRTRTISSIEISDVGSIFDAKNEVDAKEKPKEDSQKKKTFKVPKGIKKKYFSYIKKFNSKRLKKNTKGIESINTAFQPNSFSSKGKSINQIIENDIKHFKNCNYIDYIIEKIEDMPDSEWLTTIKKYFKENRDRYDFEPHLSNMFYSEYYIKTVPDKIKEEEKEKYGLAFQEVNEVKKNISKDEIKITDIEIDSFSDKIKNNSISSSLSIAKDMSLYSHSLHKDFKHKKERNSEKSLKKNLDEKNKDIKREDSISREREEKVYNSVERKEMENNFGNSFELEKAEDTFEKEFLEDRKMIKEYIIFFKYFLQDHSDLFNNFSKDSFHPIILIIKGFTKNMSIYFGKKKFSFQEDVFHEIIETIQEFIIILQTGFKLMYSYTIDLSQFGYEKEEMINLISYFVFHEFYFTKELRQIYASVYKKDIEALKEKLNILKTKNAKYFALDKAFSLDIETIKYKIELLEKELENKSSLEGQLLRKKKELEAIVEKEEGICEISNGVPRTMEESIMRPNEVKLEVEDVDKSFPYNGAVRKIRDAQDIVCPFHKLVFLALLTEEIEKSISTFFNDIAGLVKYKNEIDSNKLLSIFLYILVKANHPEILIDIKIMNDFLTENIKGSIEGYFLALLENALNMIMNDSSLMDEPTTIFKIRNQKEKIFKRSLSFCQKSEK